MSNYQDYLITFESYHWGFEGIAIPDNGETIRRKFIGYTKREMLEIMKDLIKEQRGIK